VTAPPEMEEWVYEEEPQRRNPGAAVAKFVAALIAIAVSAALIVYFAPRLAESVAGETASARLPAGTEVEFTVPSGATASSIGGLLEDAGIIADGGSFERTARIQGVSSELKAGDYTLVSGMSNTDIIRELITGPPAPDTFRLTVIEGLRIEEMLQAIADQTDYTVDELAAPLLDGTVTSPYLPADLPPDVPPLAAWEGLLFPATYDFVEGATPAAIVGRLAEELNTRMASINWSALEEEGLTPYDGLIIASLIEKEAKLDDERPVISSVIHNRLELGIALQIDATVIYALGENPGRVLNEDLRIDSPWNTYRYPGLPPTPIGGVRALSLSAAAAPDDTPFLYYVLVDTDGTHGFSETLEEHNAKVAQAREDGVLP
jgi:UPF0755 protein